MAISNYSDLKLAVATWLERTGDATITGNVADFITLAESRLNRTLMLSAVEAESTRTGSAGSRALTLPTGFMDPLALFLTTDGNQTKLRQFVAGTMALDTSQGTPSAWAMSGEGLILDILCDQSHTFLLRYRGTLTLSDGTTTNWLLTNHPDAYLFASILEAASMLGDEDAATKYELRLQQATGQINDKESRKKSRSVLTVDPMLVANGSGLAENYTAGF